jgi:lipopolysaccharide/colanic/teichoic acid biosynthesis glycosyltransferase
LARVVKQVVDRVLAALAILVFAPVFLAISIAILVTDGRPIFYRQTRVGKDGKHFNIWKFRTMRKDADQVREEILHLNEHDGLLFKIRKDPRITPLGRWLRRFSLDELPQIVHVVSGHMSVVGPRPPLPTEVEQYDDHTSRRLLVKPGLTGLWQVSGRADLGWDESVRLDLYYVENWTPALDAVILWKTIAAVIQGRGAY